MTKKPTLFTSSARPVVAPSVWDKSSYREYLKSPHWQALVERVWERDHGICAGCNRAWPYVQIDTHHLTYERLGREKLSDLVSLCHDKCHPQAEMGVLRLERPNKLFIGIRWLVYRTKQLYVAAMKLIGNRATLDTKMMTHTLGAIRAAEFFYNARHDADGAKLMRNLWMEMHNLKRTIENAERQKKAVVIDFREKKKDDELLAE